MILPLRNLSVCQYSSVARSATTYARAPSMRNGNASFRILEVSVFSFCLVHCGLWFIWNWRLFFYLACAVISSGVTDPLTVHSYGCINFSCCIHYCEGVLYGMCLCFNMRIDLAHGPRSFAPRRCEICVCRRLSFRCSEGWLLLWNCYINFA